MGKVLGVMVGKEMAVILDAKGKVQDVEKLDELKSQMQGGSPLGEQLSQMLSKETFAQMIEHASLHNVPPRPVKPGDKWPLKFT